MLFTGSTVPGDPAVPNEDWMAATPDLVVMLDGATARTETGCRHGAAWYARKLGAAVIAGAASRRISLTTVLADAIGEVAELHTDCDLAHPGTPSAGVAIVRIENDTLRYLVLGDVTVVLDTGAGQKAISDQRVSAMAAAERYEADQHLIGSPEKATALLAMKRAELAARNRPGGYWIAAADPAVVGQALTGEIDAGAVRRFAVLTDGAARAVDMFDLHRSWLSALNAMEWWGSKAFIRSIRDTESSDPRGARYPRNKMSDDATLVFVQAILDAKRASGIEDRPLLSQEERISLATDFLNRTANAPGVYGDGIRQLAEAERAAERAGSR